MTVRAEGAIRYEVWLNGSKVACAVYADDINGVVVILRKKREEFFRVLRRGKVIIKEMRGNK